jgi:hypothetical protein
VEADIPLLVDLYAHERASWQIGTMMDAEAWRWMLFGADPAAGNLGSAYMMTAAGNQTIGYVLVDRARRGDSLGIWGMAVTREVSLVDIAPHALRALGEIAGAMSGHPEPAPPLVLLRLEMGPGHALFAALDRTESRRRPGVASGRAAPAATAPSAHCCNAS